MNILLTNDDGIFAAGLGMLYRHLSTLGKVYVVAPEQERSGASRSITLTPIGCREVQTADLTGYAVDGSPVDCVKIAVRKLIKEPLDLLVSGINAGANVGINIHYSGTVGAAAEGAILGIPAAAMSASFEPDMNLGESARYAVETLKQSLPIEIGQVLNINIPPLSFGTPKGVKVVPQSMKGYTERYELEEKNGQSSVYRITGQPDYEGHKECDTSFIKQGYITVTALNYNMTNYELNDKLSKVNWKLNGG